METGWIERVQSGEVLLADGATGTNLQEAGLGIGVPPEEWVFDEPEKILALHAAFVSAGSDIILTDSFGGTRIRLRESQYLKRRKELNSRAAELARRAAGDGVLVAGSMGPTGLLMEPLGELTHDEVVENYAEQAAALAEGGVDLLLLETFFALDEMLAALEGVRQGSHLPVVCSFSFDQANRTMMGLRPAEAVRALAPLGVTALGANCGKTLEGMEQVVQEMTAVGAGVPIWCKPNAGLPTGIPPRYNVTPEEMAAYVPRYIQAGASIVGGCCGTTPAHVAAMARARLAVA